MPGNFVKIQRSEKDDGRFSHDSYTLVELSRLCRFDEFCACDFYELSIVKDVSDRDLKKDIRQRRRINDTIDDVLSQGQEYKTHCQLGERGICLHVSELTILKPGSCK